MTAHPSPPPDLDAAPTGTATGTAASPARFGRAARLRGLPWGTLVVEATFTVLAILLALAADDWRQRRENRALADAALYTFAREIGDNRERLAGVRPYHDSLAAGFRRASVLMGRGEPVGLTAVHPQFRGVTPPVLLSAAWESALTTGALRHVDYATIQALASVYAAQESLAEMNRTMYAALVSPDVIGRGDMGIALRMGAVFFNDVIPLEARLAREYDAVLRRLPDADTVATAAADAAGVQ